MKKENSLLDNTFIRILLFLMMLGAGINASGQSVTTVEPADAPADGEMHTMTLYLKNDTQVTYTLDTLDHVTYLPGIGMKVYLKNSNMSVDYLFSQMTKIEYAEETIANKNANFMFFSMTDYPEAWRLEYPQLSSNVSPSKDMDKCQVIVKRTNDYGITFSVEWDNTKIANRWTCYTLHAGNSERNVSRSDDFKDDSEVAVSSQLSDYSGSGYSRGHLCPSNDRLCSKEQNKQTFFLTNIQPQYQSHNSGLWNVLETKVHNYATSDNHTLSHCDTLYIVKAATISDKVTINGNEADGVYEQKCNNRLLVPRYFYMALLHYNKAKDTYHAMAFWTEHKSSGQSTSNIGNYAISVDELEQRTGIDFFCNLPDDIEEEVESTLDLSFWKLSSKARNNVTTDF